jgi:ATP-dependent Clp protease ATP-binding subunit ClpC
LVNHGYDESFGARPLKRAIQRYIEDPLSEKILLAEFSKGDEIEVDVAADGTKLEFRVGSAAKA